MTSLRTTRPAFRPVARAPQQGWSLLISLVFLFVLSMLGLSAMQGASLEERMAGSQRERNIAFEAAEAALRDAEQDILASGRISGSLGFASDCNNAAVYLGLCSPSTTVTPAWESVDWRDTASPVRYVIYGAKTGTAAWPNVTRQPRYIIEWMPNLRGQSLSTESYADTAEGKYQYRITAFGYGPADTGEVRLQSVFRLP